MPNVCPALHLQIIKELRIMFLNEEFWPLEFPSELTVPDESRVKQDMIDAGLVKMVSQERQRAIVLSRLYSHDLLGKCRKDFMKTVVDEPIVEILMKDFDPEIDDIIPEVSMNRMAYAARQELFSKIVVRTISRRYKDGVITERIVIGMHEDGARRYEFVIARWGENMPDMDDLAQYNTLYENFQEDRKEVAKLKIEKDKAIADANRRKQHRREEVADNAPIALLVLFVIVVVGAVAFTGTWLLLVAVPLVAAAVSKVPVPRLSRRSRR